MLGIPALAATPPQAPLPPSPINAAMTGDIVPTHDPVMIKEGKTFYVYGTGSAKDGAHILSRTSTDLIHWTAQGGLFPDIPAWAKQAIPGTEEMWAPDVHLVNGLYYLYYAVLDLRQQSIRDRAVHQPDARSQVARLSLDRQGAGGDVDQGERFQRDRSQSLHRQSGQALAVARQLLVGDQAVSRSIPRRASCSIPRNSRSRSPGGWRPRVARRRSRRPICSRMAAIITCSPATTIAARA